MSTVLTKIYQIIYIKYLPTVQAILRICFNTVRPYYSHNILYWFLCAVSRKIYYGNRIYFGRMFLFANRKKCDTIIFGDDYELLVCFSLLGRVAEFGAG